MSAEATKKALEECSNKLGDPKTPDFSMEKANTIRDLARNLDDRMA